MKFSVVALFTLMALAIASPVAIVDGVVARSPLPQVASEDAAMSDASGNVVAFDSTAVFQDAVAKGN